MLKVSIILVLFSLLLLLWYLVFRRKPSKSLKNKTDEDLAGMIIKKEIGIRDVPQKRRNNVMEIVNEIDQTISEKF